MSIAGDLDLTFQHLAIVGGFALAILLFARVFREHSPTTSIAWLLAIVFMPYVGVPAYLLLAGRKIRRKAGAKQPLVHAPPPLGAERPPETVTARILAAFGMPPPRAGNRIELISDGTVAFERLLALIESARHRIEIETFIFADDRTGRAVADSLLARAAAGVEVLLLVDALGSLPARLRLLRELSRGGVRIGVFMRMMPIRGRWSANLRNHRKLALFDGRVALTGGMNIGERYMGAAPDPRRWIDTCMVVRGPVVADLQSVFAEDWEFATGEHRERRPAGLGDAARSEVAQLVVSGPDVQGDPLSDLVVSAIHQARERVWLVSPYFVPDEGIMRALKTQAHLGNDVRVILPRRSNHWTADMARCRVLRELEASGAKLFLHPERMVHAKHIVIDDDLVLSGSANLDWRSLYFNYEMALLHYSPATIGAIVSWASRLMEECTERSLPRPGFFRRWAEDVSWLLAPLL